MIPAVLVFDVNETLIDIDSIAPFFGRVFGDRRVLRDWFGQLVTYSMTTSLTHHYVDFFTLGQGVLRMLADIHRIQVTEEDGRELRTAMQTMPAHPDVAEALVRLRDEGHRLITLTNSPHRQGAPTPLENAGLANLFERQLSVDSCGAFKPSPAVYRYACDELHVAPAECMMVAAHVWDLLGAQQVGYRAALVRRPGNAALPVAGLPQPDLIVDDLRLLVDRLAADREAHDE